jgi:hypothetical protein
MEAFSAEFEDFTRGVNTLVDVLADDQLAFPELWERTGASAVAAEPGRGQRKIRDVQLTYHEETAMLAV